MCTFVKRLLDRADEQILFELTQNARIAHSELAEKINLSRNAVRQRIERLERDGVIQSYTITVGEGRATSANITAVIFVYRHDRMRGADVLRALRNMPEIVQCEVMSGEFDLVLRVEAVSQERIHKVWTDIAALPGVQNTLTSFVLSSII